MALKLPPAGMTGLLLAGNGKGNFKPVKSLAEIEGVNGTKLILVGNNDAKMETYQFRQNGGVSISLKSTDVYAIIRKKMVNPINRNFITAATIFHKHQGN